MQPGGKCRGFLVSVVDTRNAATLNEATGTSLPWPREGKPGDAVFKALAIVPMTGLAPGVVRKVPPFDPDELIRLIKQESEA
jgi:hypothetical protein